MKSIACIVRPADNIYPIVQGFRQSSLRDNYQLNTGFDFFEPIDDSTELILCSKPLLFGDCPEELEWSPGWSPETRYKGIPLIFLSNDDEFLKELIVRAADFMIKPSDVEGYRELFDKLSKHKLKVTPKGKGSLLVAS